MTTKKYELTEETLEWKGHILHRIKALRDFGNIKAGQLGGWIEKEKKFYWNDNGKGEEYFINRVNEREVNTKYQHIGSIY